MAFALVHDSQSRPRPPLLIRKGYEDAGILLVIDPEHLAGLPICR